MDTKRYTGRVISVHGEYGFIGYSSILTNDGLPPTELDTDRDVYIHQSMITSKLSVGMTVEFEVEVDTMRSGGLRAKFVIETLEAELVPMDGSPVIPGFMAPTVHKGGALAHPMHERMKDVNPEEVQKADANAAFKGLPRDLGETQNLPSDPALIRQAINGYLRRLYIHLDSYGLTFDILNVNEAAEDQLIDEAVRDLEEMGMNNQALRLRNEYAAFKATRSMLAWLYGQDFFRPGAPISPAIITSFMTLAETLREAGKKANLTTRLRQATEFMTTRGILMPNTVLPASYLPDLFLAVPVWYYAKGDPGVRQVQSDMDPQVQPTTMYFCDLFQGNERWTDLFQMFNRRGRDLSMYVGDTIPTHIVRIIREARHVFTHVVIMTPYHDVAGMEWQDEAWLRSIDPYVVGFMEGVPHMFVLGRFSDTGLFPLHSELVADTMAYLAAKKPRLIAFNERQFGGQMRGAAFWHGNTSDRLGERLIGQVNELLAAFEAGKAFDWLRNEWSATDSTEIAPQ